MYVCMYIYICIYIYIGKPLRGRWCLSLYGLAGVSVLSSDLHLQSGLLVPYTGHAETLCS